MLYVAVMVAAALGLVGCTTVVDRQGFRASVSEGLKPAVSSIPGPNGRSRPIAASRDDKGVQSDFLEAVVVLWPKSEAELRSFIDRYQAVVERTNVIPAMPRQWQVQLTPDQRKATKYVLRINAARVDLSRLSEDARSAGLTGKLEFSSQAGLATLAAVLDARKAGYKVTADFIEYPTQAFPSVMFSSVERPKPAGGFDDAFSEPHYGPPFNVALAWQFVAAHGIQRRVRVAVIDRGFWLDGGGRGLGPDTDFVPPPAAPMQFDAATGAATAGGANPASCGGSPCAWHGNNSAGVAIGIMNNARGFAGTGALAGDPFLLKYDGSSSARSDAVSLATRLGADVISMSVGKSCDVWCRMEDRLDPVFSEHVNAGNKPIFVASAGNNGDDVGDPHFFHPCIEDHVICVGALNDPPAAKTKIGYSNYGGGVELFAPTNIKVMSTPAPTDAAGTGPVMAQTHTGTSASAPFVAGVAAMMKAINPALNSDDVAKILVETASAGVPPANRIIDALAAVRRAAQGIPIVADALENNSHETIPTNLGSAPPYKRENLNIDVADADYFRFNAPDALMATIALQYPAALSNVSVRRLRGECGLPMQVAPPTPLPNGQGQAVSYNVSGGRHLLQIGSNGVNAYNLTISFSSRSFAPDAYEPNDLGPQATPLARGKIGATIHTASDVDYYVMDGIEPSLAEVVLLGGQPAVWLSENDSQIAMQVYRRNPDGTQGALVASRTAASCIGSPLSVVLEPHVTYLVRIFGSPGGYTLRNDIAGKPRRIPALARDKVHEVLHPGEPVENPIRGPEVFYFLTIDQRYTGLSVRGQRLQLRLLNLRGGVIAESVGDGQDEMLSLIQASLREAYVLQVVRRDTTPDIPVLALQWTMARASAANTGAMNRNRLQTP